jgi:hypothetical protein
MNINKKLTREGEHETASELDLFKSRESGNLMYNSPYGIPVPLADQGYVDETTSQAVANPAANITFNVKESSIGETVSFVKPDDAAYEVVKDVIIPGELEITRGNNQGIFNIAVEASYNNSAPANTYWCSQYTDPTANLLDLLDIPNRTYNTWRSAVDSNPPGSVGMTMIMKWDNGEDAVRYWVVVFTEWGIGENNNNNFGYTRYEVFASTFVKQPSANNTNTPQVIDVVSDGVQLTRSYLGGALYNIVSEEEYNDNSPVNTRWNSIFTDVRPNYSGFTDLSNIEARKYSSFKIALDNSIGNNLPGTDLIMHDQTTDLYYKVEFTDWAQGNNEGPGFPDSYNTINAGSGYPEGNWSINPTGGLGTNLTLNFFVDVAGIPYNFILYNGVNYQVGDLITLEFEGVTDPTVIEVTEVVSMGGFSYTRTLIPQYHGIKFADGTVMTTAPNLACNTYTTGIYNIFPWMVYPTLIESCTTVNNTEGMTFITSLTGYKVAGTYSLEGDNFVAEYIGTILITSPFGEPALLPWKITGAVTAQADDILLDSTITSSFERGALFWDLDNEETIPADLLNIVVYPVEPILEEDPIQIDLYLTVAAGSAGLGGIRGIISFEIESLIPSDYTVEFVQYLIPATPVTPVNPEVPVN